jgi:hypothetical protein
MLPSCWLQKLAADPVVMSEGHCEASRLDAGVLLAELFAVLHVGVPTYS